MRGKTLLVSMLILLIGIGHSFAGPIVDHQQLKTVPVFKHIGKIKVNPKPVGANVQVNDPQQSYPNGLIGRSETTIVAVDNQHLVAGFNDAQGFCGQPFFVPCLSEKNPGLSGFAFSSNGGLTWIDGGSPPVVNNIYTSGDPWLGVGGLNDNTVFYSNLIINNITGSSLGVGVFRGNFYGNNFKWNDVHTIDSPKNTINPGSDFYDKDAIAVSKGTAFVSLTNIQELCGIPQFGFGQIEVWRTHDGGNTWLGPSIAGPEDPTSVSSCGFQGKVQQMSVPAIGPNGDVYVAWQAGPTFGNSNSIVPVGNILVARSLDGGVIFDSPVKVADFNSMFFDKPNGYNRNNGLFNNPSIAVALTGKNKGRVYITYYSAISTVYTGPSIVSSQIYLTFSDDKGSTWSIPTPIASPVPATGIKRFWPSISIEPGGNVDIVYLESKDSISDSLVDTFWIQSTNGGNTFNSPIRISSVTSDWGTANSDMVPNFGDYIGSTSGGNRVFPIWADARKGEPDVFFAPTLGAGKSK